ncbi:helix-turn-helix domain-containing protein [Pumilibacter intestinalis]|uniref:helix-turn-helix domain-containing protein n=1 Tax=Pumilibacter intestinalis TaxID=2941511 RepID=UPI002040E3D3|nr:helix-turn-helix transcriptional regulator [Pumilibacter intestinalis]
MTTNDAVAKRISKLLKEKDITIYRLEQKSGVYHGAMDRIMKGKNRSIVLSTIYKLARGFNISIYEFLDDDVFRSEDLEID